MEELQKGTFRQGVWADTDRDMAAVAHKDSDWEVDHPGVQLEKKEDREVQKVPQKWAGSKPPNW